MSNSIPTTKSGDSVTNTLEAPLPGAATETNALTQPERNAKQPAQAGRRRRTSQIWHRFDAGIVIPLIIIALLILAAIVPQLLATQGPLDIKPAEAFQGPNVKHWLGTDESGRDVFARIIHGTRSSLLIGILATVIGVGVALILGSIAGLGSKAVDFGVSRFLEVLFAFPGLLLALVVITILGPGVVTTTVAVGLSTAPGYARLIRSQVLSVRNSGYVESAVVLGRSRWFIIRNHILPNVAAPLLVLATLGVGQAIVWASSLSFLGLGATPPDPEWGSMLSAGRNYIANAWWLTVFPGLFIVISAAATTVLGHSLQRRLQNR